MIDCERDRLESALARAREALDCATLLERSTEMLIANAVLSHASRKRGDQQAAEAHATEASRLASAGAAVWTREIVERLNVKDTGRARRGRR